jgi:penicillin amidase
MRFIVFRRLRRPLRLILKITVILIALFAVLYAGWFWFSRRVIPKTRGRVRVSGVSAPVEILRDTDGIPHIYARNMEDLYFGQGYVHAQDRYWQMEFWRRMATGRLSEVLGSAAKEPDILLRTLGYQRVAEREYAEYDTVSRRLLQAYADGVNAYTSRRKPAKLGLEFSLLKITGAKFEIEPWTPVNTLAWVKFIAHAMSTQVTHEIFRVELVAAVGHSLMKDFFSPYRFEEMPVIVRDFNPAALSNGQISIRKDLRKEPIVQLKTEFTASAVFAAVRDMAFGFGYGTGSNNWVISSARSRTGKPLLANDPHLDIQIPSLWYEIGLHCEADDLNIRGFSFPGLPAVLVGHNDYIAWGATNSVPDVEDLYIERINPRNPRQYEYNGKWMDMEVRYEEIRIKGEKYPHVFPVRITQHGPIISDQETVVRFDGFSIKPLQPFPENLDLTALSLRCTALEQNKTFKALTSLNSARNFNQFRGALRYWSVPSQNFVYADVNGNIGYQLPGLIPIRKHTDGSVPSPGWVDDYEWQGYIPFDELPMAYNPSSGYIVTANNPPVGAEYPYSIGTGFVYGYRARRIVDMIEADRDGISIEDIKAMQGDTLNLSASEILPYVEALKSQDREVTAVREHLLQWTLSGPRTKHLGAFRGCKTPFTTSCKNQTVSGGTT